MNDNTASTDLDLRLRQLERDLASLKHTHDPSHSARALALGQRLAALRVRIENDLGRADGAAALRDEVLRDFTGLSAEITKFVNSVGREGA